MRFVVGPLIVLAVVGAGTAALTGGSGYFSPKAVYGCKSDVKSDLIPQDSGIEGVPCVLSRFMKVTETDPLSVYGVIEGRSYNHPDTDNAGYVKRAFKGEPDYSPLSRDTLPAQADLGISRYSTTFGELVIPPSFVRTQQFDIMAKAASCAVAGGLDAIWDDWRATASKNLGDMFACNGLGKPTRSATPNGVLATAGGAEPAPQPAQNSSEFP
jgi:hypothetical protein